MIDWGEVSIVWVVERATGLTALALLSLAVFLGAVTSAGWSSRRFPEVRSVLLHRNVSLLSLIFLAIHVVGVLADSYVDVPLSAVIVPFTSPYQTLGVALGTVAFDLTLAVLATSYLRDRMNRRAWFWIHALTYVLWITATVHALAAGYERALTLFVAGMSALLVVPAVLLRFTRPACTVELEVTR